MSTRRDEQINVILSAYLDWHNAKGKHITALLAPKIADALAEWERNRESSPAEIDAARRAFGAAPAGTSTSHWKAALIAARDVRISESTERVSESGEK